MSCVRFAFRAADVDSLPTHEKCFELCRPDRTTRLVALDTTPRKGDWLTAHVDVHRWRGREESVPLAVSPGEVELLPEESGHVGVTCTRNNVCFTEHGISCGKGETRLLPLLRFGFLRQPRTRSPRTVPSGHCR